MGVVRTCVGVVRICVGVVRGLHVTAWFLPVHKQGGDMQMANIGGDLEAGTCLGIGMLLLPEGHP